MPIEAHVCIIIIIAAENEVKIAAAVAAEVTFLFPPPMDSTNGRRAELGLCV